jgi:hypothetical protein
MNKSIWGYWRVILVATAMRIGGGYVLILQVTASTIMYRFVVSGVLVLTLGRPARVLWRAFVDVGNKRGRGTQSYLKRYLR